VSALGVAAASQLVRPSSMLAAGRRACVMGLFSDYAFTGSRGSVDSMQVALGRPFAGYRVNSEMGKPFPPDALCNARDLGMNVTFHNAYCNWGGLPVQWADLAAGAKDADIIAAAHAIMADSRWSNSVPYTFTFHHEMSTGITGNNADGYTYGTAADYIAAFRRVRSLFESVGAIVHQGGPVRFCYTPVLSHVPGSPGCARHNMAGETDPGPQYYELVGYDYYNHQTVSGTLQETADQAPQCVSAMRAFAGARGKRWLLNEFGVSEGQTDEKATFLRAFYGAIKDQDTGPGPGRCIAVYYSHVGDSVGRQPYYIDTSASSLQAFKDIMADPFYQRLAA
jgi:hypothetical protein